LPERVQPELVGAGVSGPHIVIIGAGPTGLGAGYRLQELGHGNWVVLEANEYVGGLATSFTDDAGFTYDIGGRILSSHYRYYDDLVDKLLGGDYIELEHEAVGAGVAEHLMLPYTFKAWATPPELMNLGEHHLSLGPNDTFKYPLRGGTGFPYDGLRQFVEPHLRLGTRVSSIDSQAKVVTSTDGRAWPYDVLLSTMPLNRLIACTDGAPDEVRAAVDGLHWSGSHIVGVGLDRPANSTTNWIDSPEPDVPFHRVTYLSNYSPSMTPRPDQTLLLTETSRSAHKPEPDDSIVDRVVAGLIATGLMTEADRELIVTTWLCSPDMTYPVPSLTRDAALGTIQPWLRSQDIWSRGRFGAWLYEVGDMDHAFMQGVEFVNAVLHGAPETVWIPRGE